MNRKKIHFLKKLPLIVSLLIGSSLPSYADTNVITPAQLSECQSLGLSTCPTPFDTTIPNPENMLTWKQDERVIGFRNTHRMYEGDVFKPGETPSKLTKASYSLPNIQYMANGQQYNLHDYLDNQSVTGLLILKNGEIVYEFYNAGNTENTLWTSRSVAKSIVTLLLGVAVKEGKIESVNDPITKYLPELNNSAWENVSVEQLMQHTSGVSWNEDYADPHSDFADMTICEAGPTPYECVFELVKSRPAYAEPGDSWSYSTGGAWLVGVLLERVTGTTIAKYLESNIWQPYSMENEGVWQALVKNKISMGGHGFHATLRDWGRMGLFVQNNGILPNGTAVLPKDWIEKSAAWTQAKNSPTPVMPNGQYGYQWWFKAVDAETGFSPKTTATSDNTLWALGIYGQSIGINPDEDLVIVQWSAQETAYPPQALQDELVVFFNATAEALKGY